MSINSIKSSDLMARIYGKAHYLEAKKDAKSPNSAEEVYKKAVEEFKKEDNGKPQIDQYEEKIKVAQEAIEKIDDENDLRRLRLQTQLLRYQLALSQAHYASTDAHLKESIPWEQRKPLIEAKVKKAQEVFLASEKILKELKERQTKLAISSDDMEKRKGEEIGRMLDGSKDQEGLEGALDKQARTLEYKGNKDFDIEECMRKIRYEGFAKYIQKYVQIFIDLKKNVHISPDVVLRHLQDLFDAIPKADNRRNFVERALAQQAGNSGSSLRELIHQVLIMAIDSIKKRPEFFDFLKKLQGIFESNPNAGRDPVIYGQTSIRILGIIGAPQVGVIDTTANQDTKDHRTNDDKREYLLKLYGCLAWAESWPSQFTRFDRYLNDTISHYTAEKTKINEQIRRVREQASTLPAKVVERRIRVLEQRRGIFDEQLTSLRNIKLKAGGKGDTGFDGAEYERLKEQTGVKKSEDMAKRNNHPQTDKIKGRIRDLERTLGRSYRPGVQGVVPPSTDRIRPFRQRQPQQNQRRSRRDVRGLS